MSEPKIKIGSMYQGIPFDRPCIRQLPRHWTLETEKRTVLTPGFWVGAVTVMAWVFAIVQTVGDWVK